MRTILIIFLFFGICGCTIPPFAIVNNIEFSSIYYDKVSFGNCAASIKVPHGMYNVGDTIKFTNK